MLITAAIVLALGLGLLIRGLIGRRLGAELRCRRCKYDLTNLQSQTCPECGIALSPKTTQTGLCRRRRASLVAGGLAVAAAGTLGVPATRQWAASVNWYDYLPTAWVLKAAANDSENAFTTLEGRFDNHQLSQSQIADLIEAALVIQDRGPLSRVTSRWMNLLAQLRRKGELSSDQERRFIDQTVRFELEARPIIREGDAIPIALVIRTRASAYGNLYFEWELNDIRVRDTKLLPATSRCKRKQQPLTGCSEHCDESYLSKAAELEPGPQNATMRFTLRIREFDPVDEDDEGQVLLERNESLTAQFVVTDRMTAADGSAIARSREEIAALMTPRVWGYTSPGPPKFQSVFPDISLAKPAPFGTAFDVQVIDKNGRRYPPVRFSLRKGKQYCGSVRYPTNIQSADFAPDELVRLAICFTPEAARETLDSFDFLKGEVILGPFPIQWHQSSVSCSSFRTPPPSRVWTSSYDEPNSTSESAVTQIARTVVAGPPPPIRRSIGFALWNLTRGLGLAPTTQSAPEQAD